MHKAYVDKVASALRQEGIRVAIDERNEKLGRKIRDAQMQKHPYILVLGDEEQQTDSVSVRAYKQDGLEKMPVASFVQHVKAEIEQKRLPVSSII